MNKKVSSRLEILTICKEITATKGLGELNMRLVSEKANIALGSLYNYFNSKTELMIATLKEIVEEVFSLDELEFKTFPSFISSYYLNVRAKAQKYPGLLSLHSLAFGKESIKNGKLEMDLYFEKIKQVLLTKLEEDPKLNPTKFDNHFTKERFITFLLDLFTNLLLDSNSEDERILEKLVCSVIY